VPEQWTTSIQEASASALQRLPLVQGTLDAFSRGLGGTSAGSFLGFFQGNATGCVVVVQPPVAMLFRVA